MPILRIESEHTFTKS